MPAMLKLAVISNDPLVQDVVTNHVAQSDAVETVASGADGDFDLKTVYEMQPDIALVDLDTGDSDQTALQRMEQLKVKMPSLAVFVCSSNQTAELLMAAMRAGAQEFLTKPVQPDQLAEAAEKVRRIKTRTQQVVAGSGKVISVYSTKGGLGVTTLAVNLGVALAGVTGKETALVDLDLETGDVSSLLDLAPRYNILDVCGPDNTIDETALQSCMTYHDAGVFVLAEPTSPGDAHQVSGRQVEQILSTLKTQYQYVIADTSHSLNSHTAAALKASDHIILVTAADVSSLRAAKKALDLLRNRGYGREKVHVIINRAHRKDTIGIEEVEEALDYPVYATVPNNYRAVSESINAGLPLVRESRLSNVGKSILDLAERFTTSYEQERVATNR